MTNDELTGQEPRSSTDIESDIRQTRGRMDATLDEIGNRLSARSLLNSALDWWESRPADNRSGGAARNTYETVARRVKENPIPALLVGAGVAWMIIDATTGDDNETGVDRGPTPPGGMRPRGGSSSSSESPGDARDSSDRGSGVGENVKGTLEHTRQAATEVAGAAKEKVSALGEAANDAAENVGRRAQNAYQAGRSTTLKVGRSIESGYHSSAERLENAVEEYPLAVGIGFAALGALIGVLLPRTRREDELLGEHSDQLVTATKEKGQQLLERGKVVAERVAESALEEAKQQGLTPETARETVSGFAGKVGEVARKAKEETATAAKDEKLTIEHRKQEASSASGGIERD